MFTESVFLTSEANCLSLFYAVTKKYFKQIKNDLSIKEDKLEKIFEFQ